MPGGLDSCAARNDLLLYLIYNLPIETWIRFVVWLILGLAVYFGYSRGHSVLGKQLAEQAKQQGN